MKQTETYQFNLIESEDKFLPDALNDNAEKAEQALTALVGLVEAKPHMVKGTYVGTGLSGSANPCTLTFDFEPSLVLVMGSGRVCIFMRGSTQGLTYYVTSNTYKDMQAVTWKGKTLSWYIETSYSANGTWASPGYSAQLNILDATYHYFAIG
jgi:hypothetical protein